MTQRHRLAVLTLAAAALVGVAASIETRAPALAPEPTPPWALHRAGALPAQESPEQAALRAAARSLVWAEPGRPH
jgi:hypothetical protein